MATRTTCSSSVTNRDAQSKKFKAAPTLSSGDLDPAVVSERSRELLAMLRSQLPA
jgi:hypothetical protein